LAKSTGIGAAGGFGASVFGAKTIFGQAAGGGTFGGLTAGGFDFVSQIHTISTNDNVFVENYSFEQSFNEISRVGLTSAFSSGAGGFLGSQFKNSARAGSLGTLNSYWTGVGAGGGEVIGMTGPLLIEGLTLGYSALPQLERPTQPSSLGPR